MRRRELGDRVRLLRMRDAIRRALNLAEGKDVAALEPEHETALALVRLLEIVGEAARSVSPAIKARFPEIPWREVADARNRLIHEYFDVDMEIVAAVIQKDLPVLLGQIERVLEKLET